MDKILRKCDCTDCNGNRKTGVCYFDVYISNSKQISTTPPSSPILSDKSKLRKRKNSTDKNELK
tara:strand:- start:6 stop:197 length:192 start_codon:yes stop_codon:yes gene_type:complete